MTAVGSSGAFAAVARYFTNPRVQDAVRLTVPSADADGQERSFTPDNALEALYGPDAEPELTAAIWQAAVLSAATEPRSTDSHCLLLIWLMVPRLARTAQHICRRLRADRGDIEAEMLMTLVTELRTTNLEVLPTAEGLIKAARSSAWRFARAGLKETASAFLENLGEDSRLTPHDEPEPAEQQHGTEVEISRPDGPDGLRTPLRFTLPANRLGKETLRRLTDRAAPQDDQCRARNSRSASTTVTGRRTGRLL
ncbi:hypothetical protein [Kitasatospora sp. NPDC088134]|uniref:hypothetical protein n=1 Tax=Kitasatospora sp. NPDC088134 TaxID=3364071 RepID=UPI00380797A2